MNTRFLFSLFLAGLFFAGMTPLAFSDQDTPDLKFSEKCTAENPHECPLLEGTEGETVAFPRSLSEGDTFSLQIFVTNPQQENIVSVRSWLKYDSALLKADNLSATDSDFSLAAPDGNEIDASSGQVKIGRGVSGGGKNDSLLLVATVDFEVISPQSRDTEISFVNFQKEILGETGVFILNGDTLQPENILGEKPQGVLLKLNGGSGSGGDTTDENPQDTLSDGNTEDAQPGEDTSLPARLSRPEGLRIESLPTSMNLVWELSDQPEVRGYFVYYSENSGFYIRRTDVGKTNHKEFTDLAKNKIYYFAITAYDEEGRESDYSDEVYATNGIPGSESHPFTIKKPTKDSGEEKPILRDPEKNLDDTGPREALTLAFGVLGMFFVLFACIRMRLFSLFS